MSNYKTIRLPCPPRPSDIANYVNLRLLSLKTDPSCFSSTYKRESAFTEEQWRSRLSSEDKVIVVATTSSPNNDDSGSDTPPHEEWVGTLAMLSPEALPPSSFVPPKGNITESARIYGLFAIWVHPAHRGRGLGEKLIEEGFAWVKSHSEAKTDTFEHSAVALYVYETNSSARALYFKMGFLEVRDEENGGPLLMIADLGKTPIVHKRPNSPRG